MNARSVLFLVALACGLQESRSDILDEVGIAPADYLRADHGSRESDGPLLAGFPLSEAHLKEIVSDSGHPMGFRLGSIAGFLESQGNFEKALEQAKGLDKVRLQLRAGRPADAFTDELVASLAGLDDAKAGEALRRACRPLEDAAAWDPLRAFLALLEGKLGTPAWKSAIWAEELDVAWHLDEVPALLAGKDPFKLSVLHHRLGNTKESEKLVVPLAGSAEPVALLDMMAILPGSAALEAAGVELWKREDLSVPQREQLWRLLDGMMARGEFEALFGGWIDQGGDAAPLAKAIWERWIGGQNDEVARRPVVEKLVQRWPDEARFAILLGRMLAEENPERAAQLFEKAAKGPFVQVPDFNLYQWQFSGMRSVSRGALGDPTYIAFGCLGEMQRQDRIQPLLGESFGKLPDVDRARYLAAAGMDRDFVSTILKADPTKAENAVLPELLVRVLQERGRERAIPPEIVAEISAKYPELALGAKDGKDHEVSENARKLFEFLVENKADPVALKAATVRLMEAAAKRSPSVERSTGFWLRSVSRRAAGYGGVVPPEKVDPAVRTVEPTPELRRQEAAARKATEFQQVPELFAMPEIRRISSVFSLNPSARSRMAMSPRSGRNPLQGLDRWTYVNPDGLRMPDAEMVGQVMRSLGKDHPRRVPAEILIVAGNIPCADEGLKAEAEASVKALMEGKKEARGSEAFRYLRLVSEGREPAEIMKVMEDVVKLPVACQKVFVRDVAAGMRDPRAQLSDVVYQFIVNPVAAKEDGFREDNTETRLMSMANANQTDGGLALELAERVLDRQLLDAAVQRSGPMAMRGGFDPRRRAMPGGRDGGQGQGVARVALEVLRKQGKLDAWRERATEKLEICGMFPAEIQGWFSNLEGNPNPGMGRPGRPGAPSPNAPNPQEALVLLREALKARNPEEILAVFRKNSNGRPELIADRPCLELLGPERAPALLEAVMVAPIIGRGPDMHQAGLLHLYFLNSDPALAATFRDWLGNQTKWQFRKEAGPIIAEQLAAIGDKAAAVEIVLRPLAVSKDGSGGPGAFPLKKRSERPREHNPGSAVYEKDIEVLAKWKLLPDAIKRAQELGVEPLEIAVLKLAKDPSNKTFEAEALPLLNELDEMIRSNLVNRWEGSFKKRPGTAELVVRLLEERSYRSKSDTSSMGFSIREASQYPGSSATIGRLWQRIAAELKEGQRKENAAGDARRLVSAMALAADDETWKNYWAWRSSDPAPIGELEEFPFKGGMEEGVAPERARQVMAKCLDEIGLVGDPETAFGWVATVLSTGDPELLKKVREKISGDAPNVAEFCSQTLGRPAGVRPLLEASQLAKGEVGISWNLVTYDSRNPVHKLPEPPMAKVPAMDGKFDLEILAGKDAGKLEVLKKLPAGPNKSNLKLKVPEDVKFFALRFTEPGTGRPRETTPVELQENRGLVPLPPEAELLAKGMTRKREAGPSGSPAYQVHLGHEGAVEIATLEWSGGNSFLFDAWISGGGALEVEFLDENGEPVEHQRRDETPIDAFRMAWQKRGLSLEAHNIPPRTARLRFSYHGLRQAEGAYYFSVSDARILRTPVPELPEGFTKLARVPGRPTAITISADGKKLALGLDDGRIAVADPKSGKVIASREERSMLGDDGRVAVRSLRWLGDAVYVVDGKERLLRYDSASMAAKPVRQFKNYGASQSMHVSPDGQWLAVWANGEHLLLIPAGGGAAREFPLGPEDAVRSNPEGLYFLKDGAKWELLKNADFAQGQAAEVPAPNLGVDPNASGELPVPRLWEGRLRLGESLPAREKVDGQSVVSLPVGREAVFDPKDGTIYYADSSGNIVRVKP